MKKIGAIISKWWSGLREGFLAGVREAEHAPKKNNIEYFQEAFIESALGAFFVGLPATIGALFAFDWIKGKDKESCKTHSSALASESVKLSDQQEVKPAKSWQKTEQARRDDAASKQTSLSA